MGVTFLGQTFSLYLKKLQNITVLLYLSVFYMQYSICSILQNDNFVRIIFVGRLPGVWQYSHVNKSKTITAKENVKQKYSCCDII